MAETTSLEIVSCLLPGDDLLCQGLAPQVSSAMKVLTSVFGIRKADELFATLRLITHTPAVWIERVEPRRFGGDYLV
ncbi:hypothetical protein, partial [Desulfosporosinus sp. BG]|uniref:hypothetical protein n=1 Tax=Desulfosporosinus sp. BG TaxID=1633135 RepID=UPI00114CF87D